MPLLSIFYLAAAAVIIIIIIDIHMALITTPRTVLVLYIYQLIIPTTPYETGTINNIYIL